MSRRLTLRHARDTVTVERLAGHSGRGPVYAAPEQLRAHVVERQRLVRDPQGREVVSSTTVRLQPDVAEVPVGSRVTVRGVQTTVIAARLANAGAGFAMREVLCQ